jgi:hypothetical protein
MVSLSKIVGDVGRQPSKKAASVSNGVGMRRKKAKRKNETDGRCAIWCGLRAKGLLATFYTQG